MTRLGSGRGNEAEWYWLKGRSANEERRARAYVPTGLMARCTGHLPMLTVDMIQIEDF